MVLLTWPMASMSPQRIGITISSVSFFFSGSSNLMSRVPRPPHSASDIELAVQAIDEPAQARQLGFCARDARLERRQLAQGNDRLARVGRRGERARVDRPAQQMRPALLARTRRARQPDRERAALLVRPRR